MLQKLHSHIMNLLVAYLIFGGRESALLHCAPTPKHVHLAPAMKQHHHKELSRRAHYELELVDEIMKSTKFHLKMLSTCPIWPLAVPFGGGC